MMMNSGTNSPFYIIQLTLLVIQYDSYSMIHTTITKCENDNLEFLKREERKKSKKNRDKYIGVGSEGNIYLLYL